MKFWNISPGATTQAELTDVSTPHVAADIADSAIIPAKLNLKSVLGLHQDEWAGTTAPTFVTDHINMTFANALNKNCYLEYHFIGATVGWTSGTLTMIAQKNAAITSNAGAWGVGANVTTNVGWTLGNDACEFNQSHTSTYYTTRAATTATNTARTEVTTKTTFKIVWSAGHAYFYEDGVEKAHNTTNVPTATLYIGASVATSGDAAASSPILDIYDFWVV